MRKRQSKHFANCCLPSPVIRVPFTDAAIKHPERGNVGAKEFELTVQMISHDYAESRSQGLEAASHPYSQEQGEEIYACQVLLSLPSQLLHS